MLNYKAFFHCTFLLAIAGVVIGLFKQFQWLLAAAMMCLIVFSFIRKYQSLSREAFWVCLLGTVFTMCLGTLAEYWGTHHEYWVYHVLYPGQKMPVWLPFAWGLAYLFLRQIEQVTPLTEQNYWSRWGVLLRILIALVFPVFGEIITIYLGVWTYYWPYQFLGVPIYAMLCLVFLHFGVSAILYYFKRSVWFQTSVA